MSDFGSLPNFLLASPEFNKTFEFPRGRKKKIRVGSCEIEKKQLVMQKFNRNLSGMTQYDQNTEGYIYVSVHKDVSNFVRLGSAAPTARSIEKRKEAVKETQKVVKSRISTRRDASETQVPIPKSVKMQEKIRNELL